MPASLLRILILEYFCAGGGGARPSLGVLDEAQGMLDATLEDFAAVPDVRIVTLARPGLDPRLPPPHQILRPGKRGFGADFRRALGEVEAALVVAPERDGVLLHLTRAVEKSGVINLGCSAAAVRVASDKWLTHLALKQTGVPQPWTVRVPARGAALREAVARVCGIQRPPAPHPGWIVKPIDGYACLGLSEVMSPGADRAVHGSRTGRTPSGGTLSALHTAIRAAGRHTKRAHLLVQERCRGVDASVCLIGNGKRATPLLLNGQRLARPESAGARKFEYTGGFAPLSHQQARAALGAAQRVAQAIPGLRGYFGVDLLLQENGVCVVDVNARLTTSYLLLRRLAPRNPAGWILGAARRGELPRRFTPHGRAELWLKSSAGTSAASI